MKELDFDVLRDQDAGRALYRGVFIYGGLYCFKNYAVSIKFINNLFRWVKN